jgi:PhnB protein
MSPSQPLNPASEACSNERQHESDEDLYRPYALGSTRGKAIEFYKAALGASELFRIDAEDGAVVARLSVGEADSGSLTSLRSTKTSAPSLLAAVPVRMVMIVEHPDAAFDRAVTAGATVVVPVSNQYGWRLGRIVDPFGHHWEIGKLLPEGSGALNIQLMYNARRSTRGRYTTCRS